MTGVPIRADEPTYEVSEGGSTLRVYLHDGAVLDDFLTVEINGPADSVRLSWGDAVELSDVLRDAIGMGTFKEDALREAEKRGAVKALREADDQLLTERDARREKRYGYTWPRGVEDAAGTVRALANAIESGEVTLP